MVADGLYINGGFQHKTQFVAAYEVQGNDANPGNVIIDCTSIVIANYVPGALPGVCAFAGNFGNLTVHGFAFKSFGANAAVGVGHMDLSNCNITACTSGLTQTLTAAASGSMVVHGNIHISTPNAGEIFGSQGGFIALGQHPTSGAPQLTLALYFDGTCSGANLMHAFYGGVIDVFNDGTISVYGGPYNGQEYVVNSAGGIGYMSGTSFFPCTQPGVIQDTGWVI
jgi:hypothetical protein